MSILTEILTGDHDAQLDAIVDAVKQRRKASRNAAATINLASIAVGDRVVLKDVSPKYMIGQTATVVDKRRTKIEVRLDNPVGRFSDVLGLVVSASCVELCQ